MDPTQLSRERVDVLIVGGGLAAMQAAVTAAEAGVVVGVASKRRMGRSGSSAATSGGYAAALPDNVHEDAPDVHFEDTITGSGGIADPGLVRILCDEAPARVAELAAVGGAFARRGDEYVLSASGDHSKVRSLGAQRHLGTDFTIPLADRAVALGVREFENAMVAELLLDDGEVVGVLAMDTRTGEPYVIEAGATILATGGAGQLYPVTSNPKDVTGDGYSLAARAGARLRDMEFVQFYPWRCIDPFTKSRVAVQPATFTVGAKMFNARGERFMERYEPERLEATTRDVSAIAIHDQIRQGLGIRGGVRIDFSDISPETMWETNPKLMKGLERPGIDYTDYEFIVAPEAHYYMGGVQIDEHSMSTIPRLYAVGECAGGIQGGNRLSNNALPEALVFGRRAALHAVEIVRGAGAPSDVPAETIEAALVTIDRATSTSGRAPDPPTRSEIQQLGQDSLGIVREADVLERGRTWHSELMARWEAAAPTGPEDITEYLALRSLLDTAQMGLLAATERTESRAAHYRLDHPERDDERWLGALILQRNADGGYTLEFSSSDLTPLVPTQE